MSGRVVIAVVAVNVLVIAAVAWWWLRGDDPRPAAFHGEPTSAFYAAIDDRSKDAAPLTAQEVFTAGTETVGAMRRTATAEFADCDEVLWGVSAAGCTQALQATYKGGTTAGQFVIFNMSDGAAADALVAALGKDGFVRQGVLFDAAASRAQARAMGHYVTVSWAGGASYEQELVAALVALDGLGRVVQSRLIAAV
ncbi:hypothetical protein Nocox_15700 [Nonomuraea coxensis DSM 45129]|uniref:Secreted protein n=1 Tax=Nonomuraea coxensis DSM 45129 TaxID=1122611 RepID=A0ABX8TZ49_9ACTN|nr:hypothetical protein [Nonomuraea coxensis]QYC40755.1 hypothetical protein Nocox_15700 [Nonomuraea coxensis DSM 45129]